VTDTRQERKSGPARRTQPRREGEEEEEEEEEKDYYDYYCHDKSKYSNGSSKGISCSSIRIAYYFTPLGAVTPTC